MKRITLLFLLLISQNIFAQFTTNDVKFFVGQGTETAYLVVDFKDGTDDRSYAWGYRFNAGDAVTMGSILVAVANAEPNFSINPASGTGFLNDVIFNSHSGLDSEPDWWSTWSGSSAETFSMNGGISSTVQNGSWYGLSYGFMNPTSEAPVTPIPAYSSQWYHASQITNWLGTGANRSLVVIDFGTQTNGIQDSYVFGIQYEGTITAQQALEIIQAQADYFNFTTNASQISSMVLGIHSGTVTTTNPWKIYKGTDLSNWQTKTDLAQVTLSNNEWLGLSFSARRPFIPQEASGSLSNNTEEKVVFALYPNPTSEILNVETAEIIQEATVFNNLGKQILKTNQPNVNVSALSSGIYFLELKTNSGKETKKFIKK